MGGQKVKDAGIELSIYFMPGVGGKSLTHANAFETAKVINEVNPDFVRLRTFVLRSGSPMDELKHSTQYEECTDMEKLSEIREMLVNVDPSRAHGKIASDHIINLLQDAEGYLDKDAPKLIEYIDSFLDLPRREQKIYQLARRKGFPMDWTHLNNMREKDLSEIKNIVDSTEDAPKWEQLLHKYMDRYI